MISRLGHLLLIVALLSVTGTHWLVLQSVAWTTMFADNLRSGSVSEAIAHTFDGKHPCRLCRQIATDKQSEKKSDLRLEWKKLEFSHSTSTFVFGAPRVVWDTRPPAGSLRLRTEAPPVPPPKSLPG